MKKVLVAVLLVASLSLVTGCAGLRGGLAKPKLPMSAATKAALAPILGFNAGAAVVPYRGSPSSLPGGPELQWMIIDNNHVLAMDKKTDRLRVYGFLNRRHDPVVGDKALTEDEAVGMAKGLANAARIKRRVKESTIVNAEFSEKNCAWNITVYDPKDPGSDFYARIAASTRQVLFFQVEPPPKVTPEQAETAVLPPATGGQSGYWELDPEPPSLIIGSPPDAHTKAERAQRRLYWLLKIIYKQENPLLLPPPLYYVDCFTGEVNRI